MDYRDERDALRERVENLQQDLDRAKQDLAENQGDDRQARIAALERQVAEVQRLGDALRGELDALRGGPPPRPGGTAAKIIYALLATVLAGAGWVAIRTAPPSPPVRAPVVPAVVEVPRPVEIPVPAPPPPPVPETAAPTQPAGEATVQWKAKVTGATGSAVAPGSACVVEAQLAGGAEGILVPRLTVTCGDRRLYDSREPLEGMSVFGSEVEEDAADAEGQNLYALVYEDKGARTGKRAQVSINGTQRAGSVWSDSSPAFRVDFAMPYQSEPVRAEPLLASTARALRREGVVTAVSGSSPVRTFARCSLRVTPLRKQERCLARLRCGSEVLYGKGTTGVAKCTVEGNDILRVIDESPTPSGGDPRIDVEPASGKVVVSDEIGATRWSVTIDLHEAARKK